MQRANMVSACEANTNKIPGIETHGAIEKLTSVNYAVAFCFYFKFCKIHDNELKIDYYVQVSELLNFHRRCVSSA